MRATIELTDTPSGVRVRSTLAPNGVTDSREKSLAVGWMASLWLFMTDLQKRARMTLEEAQA